MLQNSRQIITRHLPSRQRCGWPSVRRK